MYTISALLLVAREDSLAHNVLISNASGTGSVR